MKTGEASGSDPASSLKPQASSLKPQAVGGGRGGRLEAGGDGQTKTAERYVFPFEKLEVWKEAIGLADCILKLLEHVPQGRHLRLVSQMEGAATSIAQNIAEGKGRQHKKEFLQYLSIAQGSLYETVTLNEVFRIRKLFDEGESIEIRRRAEHIDRKLNGLMNSVRGMKRGER